MSARASIHAMVNLGEYGETELDQRLDALVAEVRRMDAAHLLDQRHRHIHRAIFCDGIKYSARLLEKRADEIAEAATAVTATAAPEPSVPEQSEYLVQCVRDAGSMHEKDARAFLAEHDGRVRTAALAEVTTWLIKKAREFHASSRKREREQGDTCAVLASKIARGAVRPDNLRMLPDAGFFEVDRTYRREHHGQPITFTVTAISTSPDGRLTVAHGWRTGADGWEPTDSDDLTGWTDVTKAGDS